jgi:hypothetical protein
MGIFRTGAGDWQLRPKISEILLRITHLNVGYEFPISYQSGTARENFHQISSVSD